MNKHNKFFVHTILASLIVSGLASNVTAQTLYPPNNAVNVNPDVQLKITFAQTPTIGKRGKIRVFDADTGALVDELDISIPPGPTERASGDALRAPYLSNPYPTDELPEDRPVYLSNPYPYDDLPKGRTNKNTKAGTPSANATPPPPNYQLSIIGGFTDGFHFYPIIVDGNSAIIQLHHNLLEYGKQYYVEVDEGVLQLGGDNFKDIEGKKVWRFSTKSSDMAPPLSVREVVVSQDGNSDFNTVQGALDFAPDNNPQRFTISVRNGTYHEIVYFRKKNNITIRGEEAGQVKITYANNEVFNPHPDNLKTNERPGTFPSRRATFTADNVEGIHLVNLILETTAPGQAEGLLITGERNILDHVDVIGAGDALQVNGSTYIVDSSVTGTGDTILGRGPAFFERCTIKSTRVFMWIRNNDGNHGNVFSNCTFIGTGPEPTTLARSPKNNVSIYPYAEVVLLNSTLSGIVPGGWGVADLGGQVKFWEFNSRNPDGTPVDIGQRVSWSRQLDREKDAEFIRNYNDPSFILGWDPNQ